MDNHDKQQEPSANAVDNGPTKPSKTPDYKDKSWSGANFLDVAVWEKEVSTGNSKRLGHTIKLTAGYRDKNGVIQDHSLFLQSSQVLRLAKMCSDLDSFIEARRRDYSRKPSQD